MSAARTDVAMAGDTRAAQQVGRTKGDAVATVAATAAFLAVAKAKNAPAGISSRAL